MYTNRQEALNGLKAETKACKKYLALAEKSIEEGMVAKAINFFDIAQTAKKCAEQAHNALVEFANDELSNEEFEVICEAETLRVEISKVHQTISNFGDK